MTDPWKKARADVQKAIEAAVKKSRFSTRGIDLANTINEPPSYKMGDLACSISFPLGKKAKISPRKVAEDLIKRIRKPKSVYLVKLAGAYINFFLKHGEFAREVVIVALTDDFGKGEKKKDKVMVEYSQPNPLKAFHIGHIRGTSLGESLSRILKYVGYDVIQSNLYNDIGAHVATTLWGYMNFHKDEKPIGNKSRWIGKIYSEACQKVGENQDKKEEVSEILQHLEAHDDEEIVGLWKKFRGWSIDDFNEIYKELDAHFDHEFYESELKERGREIVQELHKKKIVKKSQGAMIINLKAAGLPPWMLLKSDGTTLYSTQDLALAEEKFKKFKIDRSIHVVGAEQRLHFQQLFKTLEIMGFKKAKKCFHLAFELVTLPHGKMSSRAGTAILYNDLRDKMLEKAMAEVVKRNPELIPDKQRELARIIGIGAMKYSMLNVSSTKTIFFDWDKAMEFEGETAPYIQYACVRARRILEKVKKKPSIKKVNFGVLDSKEEQRVIKWVSRFPSIVESAAEDYKPHILANYAYGLASRFSAFYTEKHVIEAGNAELRDARLMLVMAARKTLEKSLELLGIKVPARM